MINWGNKINNASGSALVITIILLFLITTMAMITMKNAIMSEKIGHNFSNKELSFQAAEMATQVAINWIKTQTTIPNPQTSCSSLPCVLTLDSAITAETQTTIWWNTNGASYANNNFSAKYVIQFIKFVPDTETIGQTATTGKYFYRITVKGWDPAQIATSITQTTVGVRL